MDVHQATRIVFSRIQSLEPETASKIMGLLLLQDHGDKEMIRLALAPETLVHSVIAKAKKELGEVSASRSSWYSLPSQDELISPKNGGSTLNPASLPFYASGRSLRDAMDDFHRRDKKSFLNDNNSTSKNLVGSPQSDLSDSFYKRDSSVSDVFGSDDSDLGFGWSPCMYFARGFCSNGGSCRFVHRDEQFAGSDGAAIVGSPGKLEMTDTCHELIRSNAAVKQPRLSHHQLIDGSCFPYSLKSMSSLLHQQQSETQRAAALMMDEDLPKFVRCRPERNDYSAMVSPASRQIYLTFPADSSFREEDVSNYFSTYGLVQDVRIPYQQKRMFGFVTFVYPETVKMILAKGNPHFVCDSRVLVKPYKEKGKVPEKYRTSQQMERSELSPFGTPTALDSRDPFDLQLGRRMLHNTQELLWRRKLEEQALELQSRRLMNLQLLDVKKHFNHKALANGDLIPSPTHTHSPNPFNRSLVVSPFQDGQESHCVDAEKCSSPLPEISVKGFLENKQTTKAVAMKESSGNRKEGYDDDKINLPGSLEHNLPDSPFASPTNDFFLLNDSGEAEENNSASVSSPSSDNDNNTSSLDAGTFKSFNCQMRRFSSGGHGGAVGMLPGSGGPTCPVGI